jgi:hypothetical protein
MNITETTKILNNIVQNRRDILIANISKMYYYVNYVNSSIGNVFNSIQIQNIKQTICTSYISNIFIVTLILHEYDKKIDNINVEDYVELFTEYNLNLFERNIVKILVAGLKREISYYPDAIFNNDGVFIIELFRLFENLYPDYFNIDNNIDNNILFFNYIIVCYLFIYIVLRITPTVQTPSNTNFCEDNNCFDPRIRIYTYEPIIRLDRLNSYDNLQVRTILNNLLQRSIVRQKCITSQPQDTESISIYSWNSHVLNQYVCSNEIIKPNRAILPFSGPNKTELRAWYNASPKPQIIPLPAIQWLQRFLNGEMMFGGNIQNTNTYLNDLILSFSPFKLNTPIRLYRGLHFGIMNIDRIIDNKILYENDPKLKIHGYECVVPDPKSWTWNYKLAQRFASLGNFNVVITRLFQPNEILVDCRLVEAYCNLRGNNNGGLQDEVIILPGAYMTSYVEKPIPYNKNKLITDGNIKILLDLQMFFTRNEAEFKEPGNIDMIRPDVYNRSRRDYGRSYGLNGHFVLTTATTPIGFYYNIDKINQQYTLDFGLRNIPNNIQPVNIQAAMTNLIFNVIDPILLNKIIDKNIPNKEIIHNTYDHTHQLCFDCDSVYITSRDIIEYPYSYRNSTLQDVSNMFKIILRIVTGKNLP